MFNCPMDKCISFSKRYSMNYGYKSRLTRKEYRLCLILEAKGELKPLELINEYNKIVIFPRPIGAVYSGISSLYNKGILKRRVAQGAAVRGHRVQLYYSLEV